MAAGVVIWRRSPDGPKFPRVVPNSNRFLYTRHMDRPIGAGVRLPRDNGFPVLP